MTHKPPTSVACARAQSLSTAVMAKETLLPVCLSAAPFPHP